MCMVMVKSTTSCLQRLRDCRWLLIALLVTSGLYALPELFIRCVNLASRISGIVSKEMLDWKIMSLMKNLMLNLS